MDVQRSMPDGCRVFFRHRTLRPIQQAVAGPLLNGTSLILSAPTASGKTEGVFAPLYQRHVSFNRANLSVVYVAPTKALVNDMFERLSSYFGGASPDIIQRYTGDHHDFSDPYGRFALLCTPEALDSLQLLRPKLLGAVRAIVCDELHLLDGCGRGQQLRSVVARIRANAATPLSHKDVFQVVGMTATVRDATSVAARWCGVDSQVISVGDPRDIDMSFVVAPRPSLSQALATKLRDSSSEKLLIFANSRNGAHQLAAALSSELADSAWPVFLHIGILARAERERIERAMKQERRAICVATSTLEVGIDIGDIDVIVLADPPGSVSGFLQRIGRGNRRSERCVVWGCAQDDWDATVLAALRRCAATGQLDDVHEYSRPSVDFQQILSVAWVGLRQDRPLTRSTVEVRTGGSVDMAVVDDMLEMGVLKAAGAALVPSDEWCDIGDSRTIHSVIVGAPGRPLVDLHSGEVIGHGGGQELDGVLYTASGFRPIQGGDDAGVYLGPAVSGAKRQLVTLPSTRGRIRGLSRQVVRAMAELSGRDPSCWHHEGTRLMTWGGSAYNQLLRAVLVASGRPKQLRADGFGISDVDDRDDITPVSVGDLARDVFDNHRLPQGVAEKFREGTQFLHALSPALQREEARRSVPRVGFTEWLQECR